MQWRKNAMTASRMKCRLNFWWAIQLKISLYFLIHIYSWPLESFWQGKKIPKTWKEISFVSCRVPPPVCWATFEHRSRRSIVISKRRLSMHKLKSKYQKYVSWQISFEIFHSNIFSYRCQCTWTLDALATFDVSVCEHVFFYVLYHFVSTTFCVIPTTFT